MFSSPCKLTKEELVLLRYIVICARKTEESQCENQDFGKRTAWLVCVAVDREEKYDMQQIETRQLLSL